jgi:hypothetical protein
MTKVALVSITRGAEFETVKNEVIMDSLDDVNDHVQSND